MVARIRVAVACGVSALTLCTLNDATADSWPDKCKNKFHCVDITAITVSGSAATLTMEEPVTAYQGDKVVWKLPEGYTFGYDGGKIEIQAPSGVFSDPSGMDDDGNDTQQWSKRYKVKVAKKPGGYHKYTLTFHRIDGAKPTQKFVCDPTIGSQDSPQPLTSKRKAVSRAIGPITCTVQ